MKGIDRLRELARAQEEHSWSSVGKVRARMMMQIADQIERECEVLSRALQDLENRRVELCAALGIDLETGWSDAMAALEGAEAIAWMRGHGGLRRRNESVAALEHLLCKEVSDSLRREAGCPDSKVLDADGSEIHEKRDVWWICEGDDRGVHAERLRVETICPDGLVECSPYNGGTWVCLEPSELYVNRPVPASDGKPLRDGETVWDKDGAELEVVAAKVLGDRPDRVNVVRKGDFMVHTVYAGTLAHERPESKCRDCAHWQKDPTADNMGVCWFYYHEHEGQDCYAARRADIGACEEFMPRGKVLAERDA